MKLTASRTLTSCCLSTDMRNSPEDSWSTRVPANQRPQEHIYGSISQQTQALPISMPSCRI